MKRSLHAAFAVAVCVLGAQVTPAASIFLTDPIDVSETWTSDNEYILTEVVYVTGGATLTIEPGTVIRGEAESAPGANDPGTLVIARGSKIHALGTSLEPIVFTNLDDDNVRSSLGTFPYDSGANALGFTGTWGGVIVLGRAYVSNDTLAGPSASREVQVEGLVSGPLGFYGNCAASPLFPDDCDDDDSGTMRYVSIRYGGFNLSADNEINGLTLGAVGRETDLDYIEVFQNKDDGIELFGGTAQVKHVVVANVGDDGIDYDEGWRGKIQHALVVQGTPGTDKSDKGGEHDGGNAPDGSQPFAIPTLYNVTSIGHGGNGGPGDPIKVYSGKAANTALVFRDNAGGRYYNSFFADYGGTTMLVEGETAEANTSGQRTVTAYALDAYHEGPVSTFQHEMQDNLWYCFGNGSTIPTAGPDAQAAGGDNRAHTDPGTFTNAALDNTYVSCANPLPIRALARGINPSPTVPDQILTFDPRPAPGSALLSTNRIAPNDGFFDVAGYKGAFQGTNWAAGWSNTSRLGYFPACDGGNGITPDEVGTLHPNPADLRTGWRWEPGTPPGLMGVQKYDFLRQRGLLASAAGDFSDADCLETQGADGEASDEETPLAGEVFFYLVRATNDCGAGPLGYRTSGTERAGTTCP